MAENIENVRPSTSDSNTSDQQTVSARLSEFSTVEHEQVLSLLAKLETKSYARTVQRVQACVESSLADEVQRLDQLNQLHFQLQCDATMRINSGYRSETMNSDMVGSRDGSPDTQADSATGKLAAIESSKSMPSGESVKHKDDESRIPQRDNENHVEYVTDEHDVQQHRHDRKHTVQEEDENDTQEQRHDGKHTVQEEDENDTQKQRHDGKHTVQEEDENDTQKHRKDGNHIKHRDDDISTEQQADPLKLKNTEHQGDDIHKHEGAWSDYTKLSKPSDEPVSKTLHQSNNDDRGDTLLYEDEEVLLRNTLENLNKELDKLAIKKKLMEVHRLELSQFISNAYVTTEQYWSLMNKHYRVRNAVQQDMEREESLIVEAEMKIRELNRTDTLNDSFFIWHDGEFGTINGLRLGRTPSKPVAWQEVNAALGFSALLLVTIAKQSNFTFTRYRVLPMGSLSKIAKLDDEKNYFELHHNGGYFKGSFNSAMASYLTCVQELCVFAEMQDRSMQSPYPIDRETIGGISIRLGRDEALWTKALKYLLTKLKWLSAWYIRIVARS